MVVGLRCGSARPGRGWVIVRGRAAISAPGQSAPEVSTTRSESSPTFGKVLRASSASMVVSYSAFSPDSRMISDF